MKRFLVTTSALMFFVSVATAQQDSARVQQPSQPSLKALQGTTNDTLQKAEVTVAKPDTLSAKAPRSLSFGTEELKRVATKLELSHLDTLQTGTTLLQKAGRTLIVRKNAHGQIEHIGLKLFPEEYRQLMNVAVLDFLESGLLCNSFQLTRNQLKYKDAKFIKGNWQQMLTLSPSATFSLTMIDSKAYQVVWHEGNAEKINLLLPIKYDFLMNAPRKELESNFARDLQAFVLSTRPEECEIDTSKLTAVRDGSDTLYTIMGKHYDLETVTNTTYYHQTDSTHFAPVVDERFPMQTMANTLLLDSKQLPDANVKLTLITSDKQNPTLTLPLRQLMAFARSMGCEPYFGYESTKDGTLHGGLFLYNKELGYDHVLSVACPTKDIATSQPTFTARAYLYTPTVNVKDLYKDLKLKK